MAKPTFEVDKKGLAKILARRGIEFVVLELIQNALDEESTKVKVTLEQLPGKRGLYDLTVEDDNPEGFKDLAHAYTLFAESDKVVNPEQRGRFNIGEKLVIAVCKEALIQTTKGTVVFKENERIHKRAKTAAGSVFKGILRLTKDEVKRIEEAVQKVITPVDIEISYNGETNDLWEREKVFKATLATEIADKSGYLHRSRRLTWVEVYETIDGAEPYLYELGIPVVPIDCSWHVNVCQKVPLNIDRDNVTPAYMREVLAAVLNEMHDRLDEDGARGAWIDEALETGKIEGDAVDSVLTARYGEKRVIADPSDPEGTKLAVSKGYQVIQAGSFNKAQWATIKSSGAVKPAGQVTPSPKPYSDDPNAKPEELIPQEEWTEHMRWTADYSKKLARLLIGADVTIRMTKTKNGFAACYGKASALGTPELTFNVKQLRKRFFENAYLGAIAPLDELLIHEFGHHYSSDHLSEEYHEALCILGAKLKRLALAGEL